MSIFRNVSDIVTDTTKSIVKKVNKKANKAGAFVEAVISGRKGIPPFVQDYLDKHGNEMITKVVINRCPVAKVASGLLDVLSGNKVSDLPYDSLFHLSLQFNGRICLEKNAEIALYNFSSIPPKSEQMIVTEPINMSLNDVMNKTKARMGMTKFISYAANSNNCQFFVMNVLSAMGVNNAQHTAFVKQDATSVFKHNPALRKFTNTVTEIGERAGIVLQGGTLEVIAKNKTKTKVLGKPVKIKYQSIFRDV